MVEDESQGGMSRRRFLLLAGGTTLGALTLVRADCYGSLEWSGRVLGGWEASILIDAARSLIPDTPGALPSAGPSGRELADNVDRYLVGLPTSMIRRIHGMFAFVEHATLVDGHLLRFTRLPPAARHSYLKGLAEADGIRSDAFHGLRDLCLVGWYQDSRTWSSLGYEGPLLRRAPGFAGEGVHGRYDELVAEAGETPDNIR